MENGEFEEIDDAVRRMVAGDVSARKDLIQISYERLKRLARKMLKDFPAIRRWEETDDVFQRAALRLWQLLENVEPDDSRHYFNLAALQVRRELIEIARSINGTFGLARNQESRELKNPETGQNQGAEVGSDTYEASNLAAWTEFHEKVDELPEDEREVFILIWYQGLSQDAVARTINVSQKTVSRRWQDARTSIYELMNGQLPE